MNFWYSMLLPALVGLVTGLGHGWVSHEADLPMSLAEQAVQPFIIE